MLIIIVYEDIFSNNEYEASEASYRPYSAAGDKVKGRIQKLCLAHSMPCSVYVNEAHFIFRGYP